MQLVDKEAKPSRLIPLDNTFVIVESSREKSLKFNQGPLLPLSTNCMVGSSLDFQLKKSFIPSELATLNTFKAIACKAGLREPMVNIETTPLLSVKCKICFPLNELI